MPLIPRQKVDGLSLSMGSSSYTDNGQRSLIETLGAWPISPDLTDRGGLWRYYAPR